MTCDRVRQLMTEYLDGRLGAEAEEGVAAHLDGCADCRREVSELGGVWSGLGSLPELEPAAGTRRRFFEMLEAYQAGQAAGRVERVRQSHRAWGFGWHPAWQAALAASLLLAGVLGGRFSAPRSGVDSSTEVTQLEGEMRNLRQLVAISMLQQQSPASRLRGVSYAYQIEQPGGEVEQALLRAVNHDANVNVRLSAVDALARLSANPAVRRALADAIPAQESPLVKVALMDVLVDARAPEAIPVLRALAGDAAADPAVRERASRELKRLENR